ncbi:hypothetical protein CARUB_v10003066mg [Capsella rubella]|uniref:TF-B3 domain-containing protein n=1 Tax=Capsella rubella TaxID=81985 RepID=R0FJ39_9BRAS|nr:hypothetical protein CARUB_v10003066mg [Capsella rubella]
MENFEIDGDMIISKTLSKTDVDNHGRLVLPKNQMLLVIQKMKDITKKNLLKGIQLEVLDIIQNNSYSVTLKLAKNTSKDFVLGPGWNNLKKSLGLKKGDNIKLYWDYLRYKFIILNFEYRLIPKSDNVMEIGAYMSTHNFLLLFYFMLC